MTKVGFILPPTVGVLRGSRVCSTSVTTTRLVAVKLHGLNHHHGRNRLAPSCCDEYRIAPFQSGMLVCKRAGRRVHRIPIGSTRIGHVLAIALCALLVGYKFSQQRLHRGRQVVGVGLGLRHQGFGDREVEGAFSGRSLITPGSLAHPEDLQCPLLQNASSTCGSRTRCRSQRARRKSRRDCSLQ